MKTLAWVHSLTALPGYEAPLGLVLVLEKPQPFLENRLLASLLQSCLLFQQILSGTINVLQSLHLLQFCIGCLFHYCRNPAACNRMRAAFRLKCPDTRICFKFRWRENRAFLTQALQSIKQGQLFRDWALRSGTSSGPHRNKMGSAMPGVKQRRHQTGAIFLSRPCACVVFDMCNGVSFGESWGCKSFWHSRLGHYTLLYFYMVCQFSRISTSEACCRDDLDIWITPLYVWAAPSRIYSHSHKSIVQFFKLTF